jgi:hypothetical protein
LESFQPERKGIDFLPRQVVLDGQVLRRDAHGGLGQLVPTLSDFSSSPPTDKK